MSPRFLGNGFTLLSMWLWATSFPATDLLLESWHPLPIAIGRLLIGGVWLSLLVLLTGREPEFRSAPWRDVIWIGGGLLSVSTILLVLGIRYSNPVTAAVIAAMMPPVSAVPGYPSGEDRITPMLLFGILLAAAGGTWAGVGGDAGALGFEGGEPLLALAVISFAWYSRASVRRLAMLSPLGQTALTTVARGRW